MAEDAVMPMLLEMRKEFNERIDEVRNEARDFHTETRANFITVSHHIRMVEDRLGDVEVRLGAVEAHMAALLAVIPVTNRRMDELEARIAALVALAR
jgi:hypothetical protein